MGSFGLLEMCLLLLAGILIFGGDLPEVGRKIGRMWGKVRYYINQFQQDIQQETNTIQDQIEIEEADEDTFYDRQASPETKTPQDYKDAEYKLETEDEDEEQRTLQEEIEKREKDSSEQKSNQEKTSTEDQSGD